MKCRTIFYTSLGRLFMIDSGEDEDKFEKFMQPLTSNEKLISEKLLFLYKFYFLNLDSLDTLSNMLNNKSIFNADETKVN